MTPQQAKDQIGATHYMPMLDGVTPQMYYRQHVTNWSDGTSSTGWQYRTFAGLWHNSGLKSDDAQRLIEI